MFNQKPLNQSIRHKLALVLAFSMIASIFWHLICLTDGSHYLKNVVIVQKNIHEHFSGIEQNDHFHVGANEKLQNCHSQDFDENVVITKSTLKNSKSSQKYLVSFETFDNCISFQNNQSVIKAQNLKYTPNNSLFNQKTLLLVYS
jgi:hypothetical protein